MTDSVDNAPTPRVAQLLGPVDAAPDVNVEDVLGVGHYADGGKQVISHNISFDDMSRPLLTAHNPYDRPIDRIKNSQNGMVQAFAMPHAEFEAQRRTFTNFGYAVNPDRELEAESAAAYVGDVNAAIRYRGATVDNDLPADVAVERVKNKQRLPRGDPSKVDGFAGPWAGFEGEAREQPLVLVQPSEEEIAKAQGGVDKMLQSRKDAAVKNYESSTLHLKSDRDYQGRSFIEVPLDLGVDLTRDPASHDCFLPKKLVHTWTGHAKGVNAIRFFPVSGHLLLSCSMDCRVKLWDVMHDRQCIRDYLGHDKAVRDVCFTNDGRQFLSASYDKYVKLWDTETGQCISRFQQGGTPFCVKFHPDSDKQNVFLAGCGDKKILQWDVKSGEITQTYDQHIAAVNTLTFIDDNRRFVTTSDDKSIRVWDFDIPVTIKYIAEPHMHSITAAARHPNGKFAAFQSNDNQILIYAAQEQFRLHRKKRFTGHMSAGYSCQLNFSPDGKYLVSGDAGGAFYIWDWATGRVARKMGKAHKQVCMGVEWHPQEPSKLATCSWDGTIKYWD